MIEIAVSLVATTIAVVGMAIAPGTRWRRSLLAGLAIGSVWWGVHTLHSTSRNGQRDLQERTSSRNEVCYRSAQRLLYLARASELAKDLTEVYDDSWTSMQLEGHGTIRVIGPVLRYCVRDAASCDPMIDALLEAQRPEVPSSAAPAYRANLKVLAAAFESREGCRP